MPRSSRSKTPNRSRASKAASSAGGVDLSDPTVMGAITFVAIVVLSYVKNGSIDTNPSTAIGTLIATVVEDFPLPKVGGLFMTGHIVNCARKASDSFWMNSVLEVYIAANAPTLVLGLLNGDGLSSAFASEQTMTVTFLAWYLVNRNIPIVNKNVWDEVNNVAGAFVEQFLTLSTMLTVTRFIVDASHTGSEAGCFGFSIFTPLFYAVFAGAASDFFPASKGWTISNSEGVQRAIAIASYPIFIGLLKQVTGQVLGDGPADAYDSAAAFVGGNPVMFFLMVQHLAGHLLPFDPLKIMSETAQDFLGL